MTKILSLIAAFLLLSTVVFAGNSSAVHCAYLDEDARVFVGETNIHKCNNLLKRATHKGDLWTPAYKTYKELYTVYVDGEPVDVDFAKAGRVGGGRFGWTNSYVALFTQELLNSQ